MSKDPEDNPEYAYLMSNEAELDDEAEGDRVETRASTRKADGQGAAIRDNQSRIKAKTFSRKVNKKRPGSPNVERSGGSEGCG